MNVPGTVAYREDPVSPFSGSFHSPLVKDIKNIGSEKGIESVFEKSSVRVNIFVINRLVGIVGDVAAPLPRDEKFAPGLTHLFNQENLCTEMCGPACGNQTGSTGSHHDHIITVSWCHRANFPI